MSHARPPGSVVITRGHKYLRIARDLGRKRIRAVIQPASDQDAVTELLREPGVGILNWAEIDAAERARPAVEQWHVYYFERPLTEEERQRFEFEVIGFLRRLYEPGSGRPEQDTVRSLEYDDKAARAQFLVVVPVNDESWYGGYRAAAQGFNDNVVRIESFQGRRWGA